MVQLTDAQFHLIVLTASWVGGFLPIFLGKRMSWVQGVGLALVLYPFLRMALGIVRTFERLLVPTVLQPASEIGLWTNVENQIWYNLALPMIGLFLLHNPYADAGDPTRARPTFLDALRAHGAAPRTTLGRDALRGLALFLFIAVAYLAAYAVSSYVTPILSPGSDESLYWRNVTIPLIVLLALSAGVAEEFLFRGILLTGLARWMPVWVAAVLQALFFAFVHAGYGTWTHVLGPFLFGLGMAWIARRLGIVVTALLHAEINVVFFTVDVAPTYLTVNGALGLAALLSVSLALLGLCLYAMLATRGDAVRILWRDVVESPARVARWIARRGADGETSAR